ncbi:NusB antitermination factor [Desulfurobacterium thermolithotrophum DSM 11699]|uniref:Transcription antitermination protein NusB n=1 Tax=Desulfurobacterium thermolithotrophum (strain DSM 11699 / BSA) TaxID=868864 RepID=F0S3U7_DESTD|nr:transcription antitermination factor NusB [Desulfurobacterium thermolithotrophum]ADY73519.1 NusB antitermination factor [Desulfurobacterium thermolithotrophum DSM 11699]
MTNRDKKKAREHAYLMMYQYDLGGLSPEEIAFNYWEDNKESEEIKQMATYLFKKTVENLKNIDIEISRHLKKGWLISRLMPMDRSILRVATYEISNESFSPIEAVINDAVDAAKFYGEDEKSPKFINAILDKVAKNKETS